jgi:hypothetical protein
VLLDHVIDRVWSDSHGHGHGRRDARVHRGSSGKGAGTDDTGDRGQSEEPPSRWIAWREHGLIDYRRVCGWRAKHAVSLSHGINLRLAWVRAGAEVGASPRLASVVIPKPCQSQERYYQNRIGVDARQRGEIQPELFGFPMNSLQRLIPGQASKTTRPAAPKPSGAWWSSGSRRKPNETEQSRDR